MLPAILTASLLLAPPTSDAPDDAKATAEKLHKQALEHARGGDWEAAFPLWDEAQRRHQVWKYPFNQASGYAHLKRWLAAWRACVKAQRFGVPPERTALVDGLRKRVEGELFQGFALVEVRVTPPNATIRVAGDPFENPWSGWMADPRSTVTVEADGYEARQVVIDHPIGKRTVREVTLTRKREKTP